MPYIKQESRKLYNELIDDLVEQLYANSVGIPGGNDGQFKGDLNYIFIRTILQFRRRMMTEYGSFGYQDQSDCVAALKDCATEYERRFLAPYEDKKIEENGDIV